MRKALPVAVFISVLLLSAVAGTQFIDLATANPVIEARHDSPPFVTIRSPANGSYVNSVLLNVTVTKPGDWLSTQKLVSVSFQVDGKPYWAVRANSNLASPFNYSLHITDLADGSHTIVVRAESTGVVINWISGTVYSVPVDSVFATVYFTLDATPPNVSFLSSEEAYATCDVPLNFTVNELVSKICYVLDGQENVTVAGNTTLTNLPYGAHNVTVYATDNVGNTGISETITFTIAEPEPFPVAPVAAASVASIAVVGVALLVYFKKRKR
jgi:hypothetical protein